MSAAAVAHVIHGTTLVTNALIERKGARTALITTRGFRDAIEIGREHRYDMYDLFMERPTPLVPRHLRFELDERVLSDGSVLTPLDTGEVLRLVETLQAAADRGGRRLPAAQLSQSGARAGGRRAAAVARARDQLRAVLRGGGGDPRVRAHLDHGDQRLRAGPRRSISAAPRGALRALGIPGDLFLMLSNGGICDVETACRFPVRLIESGPAAGALAAAHYGRLIDCPTCSPSTWAAPPPRCA